MTKRLEQAINQLSPSQVDRLTEIAESLAGQTSADLSPLNQEMGWKFDWVGGLKDFPEQSGVDAQRVAMHEWEELIDRGSRK